LHKLEESLVPQAHGEGQINLCLCNTSPTEAREVLRQALGVRFTDKELAALSSIFTNENGTFDCGRLNIVLLRMQVRHKEMMRRAMLQGQRNDKPISAPSPNAAAPALMLPGFSDKDLGSAIEKIASAIPRAGDRGFEQYGYLTAAELKHIAQAVYNVQLTKHELGAIASEFTKSDNGVDCHQLMLAVARHRRRQSEGKQVRLSFQADAQPATTNSEMRAPSSAVLFTEQDLDDAFVRVNEPEQLRCVSMK
jgi:hypothetical protein